MRRASFEPNSIENLRDAASRAQKSGQAGPSEPCIRDDGMEDQTIPRFSMKLWARNQWQTWFEYKARRVGKPGWVVFEHRTFARALLVIVQCADQLCLIADMDADFPFQSALGGLGVRILFGMRSASRRSPWSSPLG